MPNKQIIVQELAASYKIFNPKAQKIALAIHGWADQSNTFAELANQMQNVQIIAPDLPGFGNSQMLDQPASLDDYAAWVKDFVAKIQLEKLDTVIGHSNGGAIAIMLLANKQATAGRLALIASAGIRNQDRAKKQGLSFMAKPGKLALKLLPAASANKIKRKAYKKIGSDYMIDEQKQETFKLIIGKDVQDLAATIDTPTTLIYGEEDAATPPSYGKLFMKQIPNSTLHVIDGAGHFLHQTHCEQVAKFL